MARAMVRAPLCLALSWSWRRAERSSSLPLPIPRSLVPGETDSRMLREWNGDISTYWWNGMKTDSRMLVEWNGYRE